MWEKSFEILTTMIRYSQISRKILSEQREQRHTVSVFIDIRSSTTELLVVTYKDAILKTQDFLDEAINLKLMLV